MCPTAWHGAINFELNVYKIKLQEISKINTNMTNLGQGLKIIPSLVVTSPSLLVLY